MTNYLPKTHVFLLPIALLGLVTGAQSSRAATITDGFEGTTISGLWTTYSPSTGNLSGPGTQTLTNTSAFAGSQSVELTASSTFPWFSNLTHDFGSLQYGTVSVYAQTGLLCCGSAAAIEIGGGPGAGGVLQRTSAGGFVTRAGRPESDFEFTSAAPLDWHLLEIVADTGGITFKFDGVTVSTDSSDTTGFSFVDLQVWGGPGGSERFDNFSATTYDATPEPSTLVLVLGGLAGILRLRRRRRGFAGYGV